MDQRRKSTNYCPSFGAGRAGTRSPQTRAQNNIKVSGHHHDSPLLVLTCINISYIVNSWARRKPDAQETTDTKMYGGRRKDFGKMGSKSNHGSSPGRTSQNHFEMSGGRRCCRNCAPPEDSPKYCY